MSRPANELFEKTSWSKIRRAAGADGTAQEDALNALALAYHQPLTALARRIGIAADEIEDAVQEVMVSVFCPKVLSRLCPSRGRFCHYLAVALEHQWVRHIRHARSRCRDARVTVSLESEAIVLPHTAAEWTQELDAARAADCLANVRATMESEAPDVPIFNSLWQAMLGQSEESQAQQAAAVAVSHDSYRGRLTRMRWQFRGLFKEAVAAGLLDPAEVESECQHLLRLALRQTGAQGTAYGSVASRRM